MGRFLLLIVAGTALTIILAVTVWAFGAIRWVNASGITLGTSSNPVIVSTQ